ncbi:MAG: hypothetical protein ABIK65_10335 [Candidatus Eisenbacteria bacterium]
MNRGPFLAGQIMEISIGERIDNKIYRAQVSQADERNLVLHVPGFDPLRFVDLLKGTGITLRTYWKGEPHLGSSKLAEHFKDSSPYLVIRRPADLTPVERTARAIVLAEIESKYEVRAERTLRRADPPERNGEGTIQLRRVPEPFDLGTDLVVELEDPEGGTFPVEGRVARVTRDPEHPKRYAVTLRIDVLDRSVRERLLNTLLRAPDEAAPPPDVRNP